jgi:hypothetical protein
MQTQPTNPALLDMRSGILPTDTIYIVAVNYGLQICRSKRSGEAQGKNITRGIAQAFGYDLLPNGLACSEWQIIEDLVETLPQIRQPSGLLNIELK